MTYTVEIRPAAARQLKKLTRVVQAQVIQQLEELELDPRPPDVKKLSGKNNLYRVMGCIGKSWMQILVFLLF
jgi:mRNA interferase RelE/StbE